MPHHPQVATAALLVMQPHLNAPSSESAMETAVPEEAAAVPAGLFPLPLTAFEQYMLIDDNPNYPITFFLQFRLKGQLNLEAMMEAYQDAVQRHPLLCCRVERRWGRYYWVWSPESVGSAELDPAVWQAQKPWLQQIDLFNETGVRAWGTVSDQHTEMTLQIHHACCDGIGASQFLEDIAVCYARRAGVDGPLPELRPLCPEALRHRADPGPRRVGWVGGSLGHRVTRMLHDSLGFLLLDWKEVLKPVPQNDGLRETGEFCLQSDYLDRAVTRRLRNSASRTNVSLNDLLTRDLMETLEEWNRESGGARSARQISILIPTSLRGAADDQLPAANVIGYLFLGRRRKQMTNSQHLLKDLAEELSEHLTAQYGWLFVRALQNLRKIPFLLRLSAAMLRNRCLSTAVLSHMGNRLNSISSRLKTDGDVIHVGNMTLEEIRSVPPLRCGTNAAVATYVVGGRLMVNLRCDPQTFGEQQTRQLLSRYMTRLKRTAAEE
ncbi:MAG: hypothetical protein ACK58L_13520 [Planctomycetota bacterium]